MYSPSLFVLGCVGCVAIGLHTDSSAYKEKEFVCIY